MNNKIQWKKKMKKSAAEFQTKLDRQKQDSKQNNPSLKYYQADDTNQPLLDRNINTPPAENPFCVMCGSSCILM